MSSGNCQKFWQVVDFIRSLGRNIKISEISREVDAKQDDIRRAIAFLQRCDYQIETEKLTGEKILRIPDAQREMRNISDSSDKSFLQKIEALLAKDQTLEVVWGDSSKQSVIYVHRIGYIDEGLSIIAEHVYEHCLLSIPLNSISKVRSGKISHHVVFSDKEIDSFLKKLRMMNETETRLVIKILSGDMAEVDLNPKYLFFLDPFAISNVHGDKIWAATVEVNDHLYKWLSMVKEQIEILDPSSVVEGLAQYEERAKAMPVDKSVLKKVS